MPDKSEEWQGNKVGLIQQRKSHRVVKGQVRGWYINHVKKQTHQLRLMTMSPLYPCGKHCSTGAHNETAKNLALS